jgi:hypothetical protein
MGDSVFADKTVDMNSNEISLESRLISIESKVVNILEWITSYKSQKNAESQKANTPGQIRTAVAGSKVLHD